MNKFIILAVIIGAAYAVPTIKVTSTLSSTLETEKTANIFVSFVGSNTKAIKVIESQSFKTRGERLNALGSSLKANRDASQENVQNFLTERNISFKSFWISNQIYIKSATKDVIQFLATFSEVELMDQEKILKIEEPIHSKAISQEPNPEAWGVIAIQAPEAWAIANGTGVIVATISGGIRRTHQALKHNFRNDGYGWYDPYEFTEKPISNNHGTHTMGTIVGGMGVGISPGTLWMHCRGCEMWCEPEKMMECAEWILCPTEADGDGEDCSQAPHVFGGTWADTVDYEAITEAWVAGGIIPVFEIGEQGGSCSTTQSPGNYKSVIGVGSTDKDNSINRYSSLGPTADGRIKPDISAPGVAIYSAGAEYDYDYIITTGTTKAAQHVAGVACLALSVNPNLNFEQVRQLLIQGVDTNHTVTNTECGGIRDDQFPNNQYGYGITNALKVVKGAQALLNASKV